MPKVQIRKGQKNLIGPRLKALRVAAKLSQRALAQRLQLAGMDMDKNVITRIETNKRYVTDIEVLALALHVRYAYLIDGRGDPYTDVEE
nr:helix-turn-helix transcriptional regulator [Maliibacterium massiliense]